MHIYVIYFVYKGHIPVVDFHCDRTAPLISLFIVVPWQYCIHPAAHFSLASMGEAEIRYIASTYTRGIYLLGKARSGHVGTYFN